MEVPCHPPGRLDSILAQWPFAAVSPLVTELHIAVSTQNTSQAAMTPRDPAEASGRGIWPRHLAEDVTEAPANQSMQYGGANEQAA